VDKHLLKNNGIPGEVLMYHLISDINVGPKILGVFSGGRIEEYQEDQELKLISRVII